MRRKGSYIAGEIMREYKQRKAFEKKQRANCKEKECSNCEYSRICSEKNEGTERDEM
jgi:radical SAM protein with 4Fe4S-binding SPASM domain